VTVGSGQVRAPLGRVARAAGVLACVAWSIAACAGGAARVDLTTVTYGLEAEVTLAEMTRHERGFYYKDIEVGTGAEADAGRTVAVDYVVRLADGREVDRMDSDRPLRFRVGDETMVDAFDSGVRGMRVGGTRQLVVPPRLAYGARGAGPVPPNAVLVMMVRLERVE
jgi:FKBP-type peptidyl-prolyl cis-trans isomerase FkpA